MRLVIRDARQRAWLEFESPRDVLTATRLDEVVSVLERVDAAVASGAWAAGFLTYEAAPAFDATLRAHPAHDLPLAMFGIFDAPRVLAQPGASATGEYELGPWTLELARDSYFAAIDRIRGHIAAGDTYQVNLTLRQRAGFRGDIDACFSALARAANAPYAALVETGRHAMLSLSPELFFTLEDGLITSIPMKGTAARELSFAADESAASRLHTCEKNRAENVMIVDMVRNDIGRIAAPGSVRVPELFKVERHPTVWQMTSTVTGRTDAPLTEIMRAMFPPASITGAPKRRAMEIIAGLERSPRGVYTGTVGFVAPAEAGAVRAQFNVAIRTLAIDRELGRAEYGTGGGIVWESVPADEWLECETKTRVLGPSPPVFSLLETLRWDPVGEPGREGGYFLLERHLRRLQNSAAYFQFDCNAASARDALFEFSKTLAPTPHRVRLLTDSDGRCTCESFPLVEDDAGRVRLALSSVPVHASNVFLYHKTTARDVYGTALAAFPEADDVLLYNNHGELTETCFANVCLRLDGEWVTPPVSSGLLPGTFRAQLLAEGRITERLLTLDDLSRATAIAVINSVRGWREADLAAPLSADERHPAVAPR